MGKEYMSVREFAQTFNVSTRKIRNMIKAGEIKDVIQMIRGKKGSKLLIPMTEVDRIKNENRSNKETKK